jgi:photosystem II stability/assembly factor-like uncharacterized protein
MEKAQRILNEELDGCYPRPKRKSCWQRARPISTFLFDLSAELSLLKTMKASQKDFHGNHRFVSLVILIASTVLFAHLSVRVAVAAELVGQWIKMGGPIGGLGYNIRINPTNKNIMFVTDAFSGVQRSTDGGQTWQASNTGIDTRVGPSLDAIPVFCLTIDPINPNIVWAGTQGIRGLFRSMDGGLTFQRMDSGILENQGLTIRNFEVNPTNSNIVFASGELSTGVQGLQFEMVKGVLYKTVDGGSSWTNIWEGDSLARWLCIDSENPQQMELFTGIFDREAFNTNGLGVLSTSDGGQTWSPLNSGITGSLFVGGMAMRPTGSEVTIIGTGNYTEDQNGTRYGAVFRSTNNLTWDMVLGPQDTNSPGSPDNVFTAAAFSPSSSNIVYVANALAFYRSTDGGTAWTRYSGSNGVPYGPPGVRSGVPIEITVDKDDPNTVFVNNYGGGVFKSTDGAQTWQVLGRGYTGADLHKVAVNPQNRSLLLANGRSGPFQSVNAGNDWTGISYGPVTGAAEWQSAAYDPTSNAVIYLSDEFQGLIFKSTDGGNSWNTVFQQPNVNGGNRHGAKELIVAPGNSQIVYAGYCAGALFNGPLNPNFSTSYGFYSSTNGGASWTQNISGLPTTNLNVVTMAVARTNASLVYLGIRLGGIFKSGDGGNHWTNIVANLPTPNVFSIAISPLNPNIVYAGTGTNGIFKSTDGGASWTQSLDGTLTNGAAPYKLIISMAVNPTNDNLVYAGDWYSGVYQTTNAGGNWQLINMGLSTRSVQSLAVSSDGIYVYAATKGEGVFRLQTQPLNILLTARLNGSNLAINWSGGNSYYVLDKSTNLASASWIALLTNTAPNASVPIAASVAYYRIRAQ